MNNIKNQTINALSWSAVDNFGKTIINITIGIILARILQPDEFGLIGMLAVFISLSHVFIDSGFGAALIQKKNLTETDKNTVFLFNIVIGFGLSFLLYFIAPFIANFYHEKRLISLSQVMSVIIFISSLGSIQTRLMSKELNFRTQAKSNLIATISSGIASIISAYYGLGVWSLVIRYVGYELIKTSLLWKLSHWRPSINFKLHVIKELFPYGSKVLLTGVTNAVFNNITRIIIGRFYSAGDLGYVERAHSMARRPFENLILMMGRVLFPSFSSIQDNTKLLRAGFRKSLKNLGLLLFPIVIGLFVCARSIVLALLTDKWEPIIPFIQVFAIESLFHPFFVIHLNLYKATGRSDLLLKFVFFKRLVTAIMVIILSQYGILAMLLAQMIVTIFSHILVCIRTSRIIEYPIIEQTKDLVPYLLSASIMGIVVYLLALFPYDNIWIQMLAQISTGAFIYYFICNSLRLKVFLELKEILIEKLKATYT